MYADHITDNPNVLPFNRNNCRGGDEDTCMYYNTPDGAHYNYTAVQGTGDDQSPYYRCANMAMDTYNQEHLYGDHAINGLGGYNDGQPYGEIDNPKGYYGPMDCSYPAKPTCSGYVNTNAIPDDGHQDYDWWDRYHKYHDVNKVCTADFCQCGMCGQHGLLGSVNWLLVVLAAGLLYYYRNKLGGMRNATIAIGVLLMLFFFFKQGN